MSQNVIQKLKEVMADELDINLTAAEIDESVTLFEDGLGLDSVVIVELISLVEKNFDIEFSDSELNLENFSNLTVLAEFITRKQESQKVGALG
ncbi:MAG: acyl carrier protein [Symploca sp. SIO3E6]|nr:acyl carrier protein [Caldora sp. SIO3E6]